MDRRELLKLMAAGTAAGAPLPSGTPLRSTRDDPQVEILELSFGALRELNAVYHACAASAQTPPALTSCDWL